MSTPMAILAVGILGFYMDYTNFCQVLQAYNKVIITYLIENVPHTLPH